MHFSPIKYRVFSDSSYSQSAWKRDQRRAGGNLLWNFARAAQITAHLRIKKNQQ
jgi:hypothetical protein